MSWICFFARAQPALHLSVCPCAPGPALGHFQQVPAPFWQLLTLAIGIAETARARKGWQEPTPEGWFKLRPDYSPGATRARWQSRLRCKPCTKRIVCPG